MSSGHGPSGWRGLVALGMTLLALGGCGSNPPVIPAATALATNAPSPTPIMPAPSASSPYGDEGRYPNWRVLNDTDAEARVETREGDELPALWIVAPHSWTPVGVARGHVDGMPDISAHLLDEACRELDSVPMVGWEETFTIVIAAGRTLSIEAWKPGDDEKMFSPPRSTLVPAVPKPRCGVDYTPSPLPSPSPS